MTLPVSGPLSMSQVNVELSRSSTALISLGESAVRTLAGVPSGTISFQDLRGKSAGITSVSANNVSGLVISPPSPTDVFTTNSPNPTPVGGTAPYTYAWTYVSGSILININLPSIQNPTWEAFLTAPQIEVAVWRVTVTDANGSSANTTITVTLQLA